MPMSLRKGRRPGGERAQLVKKILTEIEEKTKCREDDSKAYNLPEDIQSVWSRVRISKLLALDNEHDVEVQNKIKTQMTTIITIALFNKYILEHFLEYFFEGNEPMIVDSDLPVSRERLEFLDDDPGFVDLFLARQYRFCPYVIRESDSDITEVDSRWRLPFEKETYIGSGSYGDVCVVPISHGYLKARTGENRSVSWIWQCFCLLL